MDFPWLTVLWLLPLVGAVLVLVVPAARVQWAKTLALVVSLAVLVLVAIVAMRFDIHGERFQLVESHEWIPAFGTRYTLGLDGVALVLVVLTALLVPLLLLAGWNDDRLGGRPEGPGAAVRTVQTANPTGTLQTAAYTGRRVAHIYVALILMVESMVLMSFTALDILLFYIFFEAMLVPLYFLIGGFGRAGERVARAGAAVKFLLYNLFGGLMMMAAVIGLYVVTAGEDSPFSGGTFDFRAIADAVSSGQLVISSPVANALFLGFMFAFAVKAPLWPLHTWLPDAAERSTPAVAVLMMAVVDKVGTFAMLRYCLELFPGATQTFAPWIIALAVVGVVYGAVLAIGQTDILRLIAYTSISHFGFIVLGIFALTSQSLAGSTLYMFNHGISTAALFLIAGFLVSRRGTRAISAFGGVQKVAPIMAGTFLVAGMATLSLPGLAPFISEFLVMIGTYPRYPVAAVVSTIALVLAALYILWLYQRVMAGPLAAGNEGLRDLVPRELVVVAPLLVLLVVLGFYPKPVLDVIDPAVGHTLSSLQLHDPRPAIPGTGGGEHE
ncbi:NADH-quinone oxidoreductase subunit M [Tomitella biformata]|uniref:NADH-quinone oxidoreductase subunit M n=1 Tax=Tomitella biformata TaxID=630403 RepID=UPI0004B064A7